MNITNKKITVNQIFDRIEMAQESVDGLNAHITSAQNRGQIERATALIDLQIKRQKSLAQDVWALAGWVGYGGSVKSFYDEDECYNHF